ncbi:adenine deaminase [Bacillus spongiae]|uniref:Adenine deaminase n=1 Tax=Bacillus spongiae TaxID=2683610 RepID=A0ABU8HDU3_9BACI
MQKKQQLTQLIKAASKDILADVVIKNGQIVDVFNGELLTGDIAIHDGMIVGIGEYDGKTIIDAKNQYICPGFIDAHVHIESSLISPSEFAKVVLPHGVTAIITDPHEIANVSGVEGIQYMVSNSENLPLEIFFMLPSSVPATPFEHNGATLLAEDLKPLLQKKQVLGLAEVMDFPSVKSAESSILDKLTMTSQIDGHGAGLDRDGINIYRAAGIQTDHEATTIQEAKERLQRGMHLLIREGSVAKDLSALLNVVTPHNMSRCMFCTDDKHLDDLITEGSIDHNVRLAIQLGLAPITAVTMASFNVAQCYGLQTKGAVAPGFEADLMFVDNLDSFNITSVYKAGKLVASEGKYVGESISSTPAKHSLTHTVQLPNLTTKQLEIKTTSSKANIIEIIPNSLVTKKVVEEVDVANNCFLPSLKNDQLKLAVIERHNGTGNIGLGIVKGFQLKEGAIATTIAHDSHNLVVTGTNDEDILCAISALEKMNGGLVFVKDGHVIASLSLPLAGLMSEDSYQKVNEELVQLKKTLIQSGFQPEFNPFLTLSFLTLPVIPELKLTDKGLFDVKTFQHIPVSL